MENSIEDQSLNNNALLEKVLLEVEKYYINQDIVGTVLEYSPIDLGIVQNQLDLIREWVKIQKKLSKNQDDYPIVQKLQEIELKYYKPIIYKLVDKEDSNSLEDLQQLFEDLASLSSSIGEYAEESDISALKYYSDAAIFYQYQYAIKQQIQLESESKIDYTNLSNLKQKMLTFINKDAENTTHDVAAEIEKNKTKLDEIRSNTEQKLTGIDRLADENDAANYISQSEDLFKEIAFNMKGFLNHLHEEAKKEMGLESPCKYSLIGLGSMALNQMTPYSDIEFAILTENNDYKKDPATKDYFRNLSHLIHFKVINLGETIIPTSRYGLDMSHLVHPGVNFDLGGKTPLGRIDGDKPYDLIKTVEEMMWYVRNEDNKSEHIDKSLPFILEKVTYITENEEPGNEKLVKDYKDLVKDFLQQPSADNPTLKNHQFRALKVLKEGSVEFNYLQQNSNQLLAKNTPGDLERLQPQLGTADNDGQVFNVKQEIYRLPDRMIYNLGLYYMTDSNSAWKTMDDLAEAQILYADAVNNIKYALSYATVLRLRLYSHYESQQDDLGIFSEEQLQNFSDKIFSLSEKELEASGALFKYFYTAIQLHKEIEKFCDINLEARSTYLQSKVFYDDSDKTKGIIFNKLLKYEEASIHFKHALRANPSDLQLANFANVALNKSNKPQEALDCLESFFSNTEYNQIPNTQTLASLFNIAETYRQLDQNSRALEYYEKCEKAAATATSAEIQLLGKMSLSLTEFLRDMLSRIHNNVGLIYVDQSNPHKAIEHYLNSLKMKDFDKEKNQPGIAATLHNIGSLYDSTGDYNQALQYNLQALEMRFKIYKGQAHIDTINSLHNISIIYEKLGKYDKSLDFYKQELQMLQIIDGPDTNSGICVLTRIQELSMLSIGPTITKAENFFNERQYDQALSNYSKALDEIKLIGNDYDHIGVAKCNKGMAHAFYFKKQYQDALDYYNYYLTCLQQINNCEKAINISFAQALHWLSNTYCHLENHTKSLELGLEAMKIMCHLRETSDANYSAFYQEFTANMQRFCQKYSLDLASLMHITKIWSDQDKDFLNYKIHFQEALHLKSQNVVSDALLSYRLAWIFTPKENCELKQLICKNVSEMLNIQKEKVVELFYLISDNEPEPLKSELNELNKIDLNIPIMDKTLLIHAISQNSEELVKILIDAGADVNKPDNHLSSPLYYSLGYSNQPINLSIVKLLLENNSDAKQAMDNGDTPMHMSHYKADLDSIKLLLQYGADINVSNAEGKTPLHCLLEKRNIDNDKKLEIINKFQNYYNVLLEDNNDRTADDYVQEYCIEASEDLTLALASSLSLNHSGDIEIAGELPDSIV